MYNGNKGMKKEEKRRGEWLLIRKRKGILEKREGRRKGRYGELK